MDEQRSVILCGDNDFFRTTFAGIVDDVGWRGVLVPDGAGLAAALETAPAGNTLVAIDLAQADADPMALLRVVSQAAEGTPVIAMHAEQESPDLLATLKRAGVAWFFDTAVAKHEILYALKSLFNPQVAERRLHPRAPTELPVEYWSGNDKHRTGTIRDMSEGGMFIECEERYILGTRIHMRFSLLAPAPVAIDGEVVFTSPRMQRQSALVPGVGVKFRDLSPEDLAALQDYIERILKRMPDTYNKRLLGLREGRG